MDKGKNREIWLNRINEYKSSGLSQKVWCTENDLKFSSFKYWLARSNENPSDNNGAFEFASVSISKENFSAIAVEVNGVTLSVNNDYDEMLLIKLLKTLKKL